jgi:hypothetical protein
MEPAILWGRLVGMQKDENARPIQKYLIHEFAADDTEFPTGGYLTTWLIVPWEHDHPTRELGKTMATLGEWRRSA